MHVRLGRASPVSVSLFLSVSPTCRSIGTWCSSTTPYHPIIVLGACNTDGHACISGDARHVRGCNGLSRHLREIVPPLSTVGRTVHRESCLATRSILNQTTDLKQHPLLTVHQLRLNAGDAKCCSIKFSNGRQPSAEAGWWSFTGGTCKQQSQGRRLACTTGIQLDAIQSAA